MSAKDDSNIENFQGNLTTYCESRASIKTSHTFQFILIVDSKNHVLKLIQKSNSNLAYLKVLLLNRRDCKKNLDASELTHEIAL